VRLLAAGGTILVILFALLMGQQLMQAGEGGTAGPDPESTRVGNMERIGLTLFQDYILPFEVASLLLLVAMIGAIVLAREAY
jgi:NADH-quinone oxidoreductase subunit J